MQEQTVVALVAEACEKLKQAHPDVNSKMIVKQGKPVSIVFSKTVDSKKTTMYVHNITVNLLALIGGALTSALATVVGRWSANNVNLTQVVLNKLYSDILDELEFDWGKRKKKILSSALVFATNVKDPRAAVKVYNALQAYVPDTFEDAESVKHLTDRIDHFRPQQTRNSMLMKFSKIKGTAGVMHKLTEKQVPADSPLSFEVCQMLCKFVAMYGTPDLEAAYQAVVEKEVSEMRLATSEDLAERLSGLKF